MATLIKPGSLLVLLVAGLIIWGMFGWFQQNLASTVNNTETQREDAVRCSSLSLAFRSVSSNSTHTTAMFEANQDLQGLYVEFAGDNQNVSRVTRNLQAGELGRVSAPLPEYRLVTAQVPDCDRVFEHR